VFDRLFCQNNDGIEVQPAITFRLNNFSISMIN